MKRPFIGSTWTDHDNRTLTVTAVNVGDTAGREVLGTVLYPDSPIDEDYACTLPTWADIWRDKVPAANPERMKIG